jgi:8-hydroxy-5-deazaflavin:NADPH oxidoreductase
MKIGVLGTGDVGKRLATGFLNLGHEVMIGSRDPMQQKVQIWINENGEKASGGTFEEAAKYGELLVLATLWTATDKIIEMANPDNFKGKIVIDTTNPLDFSKGAPPGLSLGGVNSAGERVQEWLPGAYVVKAFNTVGNSYMAHPVFEEGDPDLFICGNHDSAKKTVTEICTQFGWKSVIDIGDIKGSRYLEPLAIVWVLYGFKTKSWNHAFKILKK